MSTIIRRSAKVTLVQGCKRSMATSPLKKSSNKSKWCENLSKPVAADMIGTPDPISNLRPVKYYIPPNETAEEKEWRESCIKVDAFNEKFWHDNNTMFAQAKADYEDSLKAKGEEVTAEAMSVFYKDFLNKAYDRQMEYNRAWWKMNIAQLYPGFKAAFRSLKPRSDAAAPSTQVKGNGFWEKSFES